MTEILHPVCPQCGQPPAFALAFQAFCGNDQSCPVVCWNPCEPFDFSKVTYLDLSDLDKLGIVRQEIDE